MMLREGLVLTRTAPGVYQDADGSGWRLVPVDRAYPGKRGPAWYLQKTEGKATAYQSGVFTTHDENRLSADYLDRLGVKVYLDIAIEQAGQVLRFTKRKATAGTAPASVGQAKVRA